MPILNNLWIFGKNIQRLFFYKLRLFSSLYIEKDLIMKKFTGKKINYFIGFLSGIINGLLGAGGGMLSVPTLKTQMTVQKAHATTVAIIMPMCLVSSVWYILAGRVTIRDALPYAPFGIVGALIGAVLLTKMKAKHLRILFSLFMIWAGIRMIMR